MARAIAARMLSYSPPAPRRRWRTYAIAVLIALAIPFAAWEVASIASATVDRRNLVALQRAALDQQPESGQVASSLAVGGATCGNSFEIIGIRGGCQVNGRGSLFIITPFEVERFLRAAKLPNVDGSMSGGGFVLLCERQRPDGGRRLVLVSSTFLPTTPSQLAAFKNGHGAAHLVAHVVEPATGWRLPRVISNNTFDAPAMGVGPRRGFYTILAGRPDSSKPTDFTVDYEVLENRGTIVGRLRNDDAIEWLTRPKNATVNE